MLRISSRNQQGYANPSLPIVHLHGASLALWNLDIKISISFSFLKLISFVGCLQLEEQIGLIVKTFELYN